jgi:hypothetical protein
MATKKQTTRRDDAAEIAGHISAILNNPATPVNVYNALVDAVHDLDAPRGFFDSAAYIEMCLRVNARASSEK